MIFMRTEEYMRQIKASHNIDTKGSQVVVWEEGSDMMLKVLIYRSELSAKLIPFNHL